MAELEKRILLAIETATSVCSVALLEDGYIVEEKSRLSDRRHNEMLPGMVAELLDGNGISLKEISAIAVSIGPGSFTGLRVGLSYAKGLAMAVGAGIITVGTLEALAYRISKIIPGLSRDNLIISMTTARKGEAFAGFYKLTQNEIKVVRDVQVLRAHELLKEISRDTILGGEGAERLLSESVFSEQSFKRVKLSRVRECATDIPMLIEGIQASAVEVGELAFSGLLQDIGLLYNVDDLEPMYLKEFTIRST